VEDCSLFPSLHDQNGEADHLMRLVLISLAPANASLQLVIPLCPSISHHARCFTKNLEWGLTAAHKVHTPSNVNSRARARLVNSREPYPTPNHARVLSATLT
jgi:hypothetical protein